MLGPGLGRAGVGSCRGGRGARTVGVGALHDLLLVRTARLIEVVVHPHNVDFLAANVVEHLQ